MNGAAMDLIELYRGDDLVRAYPLGGRALEVGRSPGCDIVVHDPGVRDRHVLLVPDADGVRLYDLAVRDRSRALGGGQVYPLGACHRLVRAYAADLARDAPSATAPLARRCTRRPPLALVVGRGGARREIAFTGDPLAVGSAPDNDLVLSDGAVSAHHLRLEPTLTGVQVRDLGSRNGTLVDGVPVQLAQLEPGARVGAGRTELRLVTRGDPGPQHPVARSGAMREVLDEVDRLASLPWPVLIEGESGAGKEEVARALHRQSPRAEGPFIAVNSGAMPANLVESELFGHERGAFTGADRERKGVFEQAHGGTLFLDEIGELPLALQAKLLRVLETWRVRPVGSERERPVEVRLICATHRDLRRGVQEQRFRQDLFFRLARLVIVVPPLRERPDDIEPLAERFLAAAAAELGPCRLGHDAVGRLQAYGWPGNVRELRNVVQAAAAGAGGAEIEARHIERALARLGGPPRGAGSGLEAVVARHGGNLSAAARALGVPRSTLRDRLAAARRASSDSGADA
ncbi:MAG: sigma 54-interacting transcriptional regulator [Sandaracinaceae bacterium]